MISPLTPTPHLRDAEHDPFSGPALQSFIPLTEPQREIWFATQIDPEANIAFNEGLDLTLRGNLHVAALNYALRGIVARHESLRSVVSPDGQSTCVLAELELQIPIYDLRNESDPLEALGQAAELLMRRPMNLGSGPLIHFELYRTADDCHHLLFVAHHIVFDGWSGAVIITELGALYSAAVEDRAPQLAHEPARYGDYALIETEFLQSEDGKAQERYWLDVLADPPSPIELPTTHLRPLQRGYAADRVDLHIDAELTARLRQMGAAQGCSLVVTLLTVFSSQIHRLTGSEDMIVGLAAAGQSVHGQPHLVGHCVNLLPLRLRPSANREFSSVMTDVKGVVLDAFENQGVTFGALIPKLKLARDPSRALLISVVFNIDVRDDDISHTGLSVKYDTLIRRGEVFEMFVNVVDNRTDLVVECSYNTGLFSRSTIEQRLREYKMLIESVCASPSQPLSKLAMVSEAERQTVLQRFASTALRPLSDDSIVSAISWSAEQAPQTPAVECGDQVWSYEQLMRRSAVIANALHQEGVGPGDFVGVCLQRTPELPASLLAVLRSGAAYVPLDPDLPSARLQFMAEDAGVRVVLCEQATLSRTPGNFASILLEDIPTDGPELAAFAIPADSAAYAIYTSGSTGKPKGVVAHHRGVINCLAGTVERIPVKRQDGVLALATYAFDASVLEIFLPLVYGARLVMVTREQAADGRLLAAAIARHEVTRIFTAPAAWRLLLGAGWSGDASIVGVSWAEPLTRELAAELLPRLGQLWNLYGPTETTVWMLGARVTDPAAPITIGRPIPNTRAYILDAGQQPVPIGVVGELCIGGAGVALGYLHRPELDAERFVPDPFWDGRMYRTGDLARWTADGEVECLGRADQQVKLRGYRIEPGEIESALAHHPAVADCVCGVCERAPGDPRLVAWVQFRNGESLTAAELRAHLRQDLPGYMIPQHFVDLPQLPRLDNGKLDRKNLPDPFLQVPARITRTPPTGSIEQAIASIWQEILGGTALPGRDDRFIDLGGHSLLAVQVAARVHARLGVRLPLRDVMMEPLSALALSAGPTPPEPVREPAMPDPGAAVVPRGVGALARLKRWLGS